MAANVCWVEGSPRLPGFAGSFPGPSQIANLITALFIRLAVKTLHIFL